jgi:hypothetical protein
VATINTVIFSSLFLSSASLAFSRTSTDFWFEDSPMIVELKSGKNKLDHVIPHYIFVLFPDLIPPYPLPQFILFIYFFGGGVEILGSCVHGQGSEDRPWRAPVLTFIFYFGTQGAHKHCSSK